jgi:HSP20 family protein
MSALSEPVSPVFERFEAKWEGVFVVASRSNSSDSTLGWRPPVNAYRCSDHFLIFADLAGVAPQSIEILTHPGSVVIRGRRAAPAPVSSRAEPAQLLALEIDQGAFERVLDLPLPIDPRGITTEYNEGMLQIRLPFAP